MITLENILVKKKDKTILSVPHFSLSKGSTCGIMGPNGAGKSTLLKTLSFLERPSSGTITFQGAEITGSVSLETRRHFAVALQQSLLLDTSVYQNVALGLKLRNRPKREIRERVEFWLQTFSISHLSKKNALQLSGGEAQRVNLARAMVLGPKVLFLDEPFSALDFPTKSKLIKDLKDIINKTETTTVLISHDLMEIKYFTENLAILIDGQIKQYGATADVLSNPNAETAAFIGEWNKMLY
ncbi:ABC transporter ATP-binding protein [Mesobacillus zeae]|uniref:ATP-binding cassette domain-containing protein n=1 Tax=Mesobacillus zeae TaxID=1917180 RepID=A0A398BFA5_9BACI|nr:ATP-binding cassette domain-containing protein [Mesobacillus zeae]RID86276.1 ATP-binding cassette domain-containing protein [Mesobacillus zeae]